MVLWGVIFDRLTQAQKESELIVDVVELILLDAVHACTNKRDTMTKVQTRSQHAHD